MSNKIILASHSPRRLELLHLLFEEFESISPDVDETLPEDISPDMAVETLAEKKAKAVAANAPEDAVVIGADTVVAVDDKILGKPRDEAEAAEMLRMLSGKSHYVYTGVSFRQGRRMHTFYCCTEVEFCRMTEEEIAWYVSTGEPADKAGAYGIQGWGARFIKGIKGDYYNVMGLPVNRIYTEFGQFTK